MSNNIKSQRLFRFSVYQGDRLLCEVCDSADKFNPPIRNSVMIRGEIHGIITKLCRVLSQSNYNTLFSLGSKNRDINFKKFTISEIEKYNNKKLKYTFNSRDLFDGISTIQDNFKSSLRPKTKTNPYNPENVGVECKFGLYINDNTIVERNFYVENYNSDVVFSTDIVDTCDEILYEICERLRNEDINFLWENKDMNEKLGLQYSQIFELKPEERAAYIRQLYK